MKNISVKKFLLAALLGVGALVFNSCKGDGLTPEGYALGDDGLQYSADPIDQLNSVIEGNRCLNCHGPGGQAGLDLSKATLVQNLVDVPSSQNDQYKLVSVGAPDASLLYLKLTQEKPPVGARMPADNQGFISDADAALVAAWINSLGEAECDPTNPLNPECYECTAQDSVSADAPNNCCDPLRYEAECYQCTALDSADRTKEKCYQCTEADKTDPTAPAKCICTQEQMDDPTNANCYDPVLFKTTIVPIFEQCLACHVMGGQGWGLTGGEEGGLVLDEENIYASLVNVAAFDKPEIAPGVRVTPGDPANSYLYIKITEDRDQLEARGKEGVIGPMPPTGPMDPDDVELIRRWIAQGAQNN